MVVPGGFEPPLLDSESSDLPINLKDNGSGRWIRTNISYPKNSRPTVRRDRNWRRPESTILTPLQERIA